MKALGVHRHIGIGSREMEREEAEEVTGVSNCKTIVSLTVGEGQVLSQPESKWQRPVCLYWVKNSTLLAGFWC